MNNPRRRIAAAGLRASLIALAAASACAAQAAALLSAGHVPSVVAKHEALVAGTPDAARVLRIAVALPLRHEDELDQLLRDLYDPRNPAFRQYLSVAQFTERFGPTADDYSRAVAFFKEQGFTVTGLAANRYLIEAEAPVATLERTLHVQFGLYKHAGDERVFIAPDREPTLDLDVAVKHITGLDDETLPYNRLQQRDATFATSPVQGSAPGGWYLGSDIRAAYYGNGPLTGTGQSVGLMELAPFDPAAVSNYFQQFGPALTTAVMPISADGTTTPTCVAGGKCSDGEQDLDIEYAIAMAPGLSQVQVYVSPSAESVLNKMASDNSSAQLSTSWGWKENEATDDAIFKEMASQGQTLLTASGDYSTLKLSGPWPEESAYITGVGGTDLYTNGPGGSWASEKGWSSSAGGPSTDPTILIPTYQKPFINASNGGSTTLRNVPDIGGDADTVNYICSHTGCGGGSGGTSFASPIWAGYIALANEQAASEHKGRIGFLNPLVYRIGGNAKQYATMFHDIVGNKSGKFTAVTGFDLVTGFGSPNAAGLATLVDPR